jgi:hypothetical protein
MFSLLNFVITFKDEHLLTKLGFGATFEDDETKGRIEDEILNIEGGFEETYSRLEQEFGDHDLIVPLEDEIVAFTSVSVKHDQQFSLMENWRDWLVAQNVLCSPITRFNLI